MAGCKAIFPPRSGEGSGTVNGLVWAKMRFASPVTEEGSYICISAHPFKLQVQIWMSEPPPGHALFACNYFYIFRL